MHALLPANSVAPVVTGFVRLHTVLGRRSSDELAER
jgi:hypothetical protein